VGPTCRREGERGKGRRGAGGPCGPKAGRPAGFGWAVGGEKKEKGKRKRGRWAGPRVERWVGFFFFFFKSISNPFEFKSFTCFQIQILTQISPTILKAFHKPFLTTFQTYFKFKPLHKFSQTISLFLRTFSQII
jgi:hypothetical protein